jgi:hypothetical protein
LVGKKTKSRKIFNFTNTFLRNTSLAILNYSAFGGDFAQTQNFCSLLFCWQFGILSVLHASFLLGFFNGRLGADPNRFACKTRAAI